MLIATPEQVLHAIHRDDPLVPTFGCFGVEAKEAKNLLHAAGMIEPVDGSLRVRQTWRLTDLAKNLLSEDIV